MISLPDSKTDEWFGFKRHIFPFEGRDAWIVEPAIPAPGTPWSWCMEWPTAFVKRTGVPELLARGFHHVHISAKFHGNDEDQKIFRKFQDFLLTLGFAPEARLIGMSFGGLYALRYAAENPGKAAAVYLDAPVCSFRNFRHLDVVTDDYALKTPGDAWTLPGLPVNLAGKLTKIPILLIYGKEDLVVPPADNAEPFLARLEAAGGHAEVIARNLWGHHPHGLDDTGKIVDFLTGRAPA